MRAEVPFAGFAIGGADGAGDGFEGTERGGGIEAVQPCEKDDSVGGAEVCAIEGVWTGCRGLCEGMGGAIEMVCREEREAGDVGGFFGGLRIDVEKLRDDARAECGAAVRKIGVGCVL